MATFNRAHLITESLEAICDQTFRDWECLVIDDESVDETRQVVLSFGYKDSRVIYWSRTENHKKGLPGCRNQGLEKARGEHVVFMDDDDIPHPQLLEISFKEISRQGIDFCRYLRTTFTGEFNNQFTHIANYKIDCVGNDRITDMVTGKLPFNSCQVLWKKTCFEKIRFEEDLMFAEEWECYSRILLGGFKGVTVDQLLYFARKHPKSNTGEYKQKNKVRINSHISAARKILYNLSEKGEFNEQLKKFFIRLGIDLNSLILIEETLKAAETGLFERMKYRVGFKLYPFLKPVFYLKNKIQKN